MSAHGNPYREFYEHWVDFSLEWIRFRHVENSIFQKIREKYSGERNVVDLCRAIIDENSKDIERMIGEIEYARDNAKEVG